MPLADTVRDSPAAAADDARLRVICIDLSLGQTRIRLLQEVVTALIVASALVTAVPMGRVIAWLATLGVTLVLSAVLDNAWRSTSRTLRNANRFVRAARGASLLGGSAWGSVVAYAMPPLSHPFALGVVLIALTTVYIGHSLSHAATPRLFWYGALPQWAFVVLALIGSPDPLLSALVLPGCAFIAMVGVYNHRLYRWTLEMVRLRVHNERLLSELRAEQEQTQDAWARVMEQNRTLSAAQDRLIQLASTDDLTGVLNRRAFLGQVANATVLASAGGSEFCLGILDVDHFKSINDRFGHAIGDETLRTIADSLRSSLRLGDVVGRIGGEEFGLLLRSSSLEDAGQIAERLRQACLDARIPGCPELRVTASIGVTTAARETDPTRLLRLADIAMYTAKDNGRNRVELLDGAYAGGLGSLPS